MDAKLKGIDYDIDVQVYQDGVRGSWRNPMHPHIQELLNCLLGENTKTFFFAPLKCEDETCSCYTAGKEYGCSWAVEPWNKNGLDFNIGNRDSDFS